MSKLITACLVVHNEEKLLQRCLESIKDLVDEIIIAHDGECSDGSLEIAKKYTDQIFVESWIGAMEPHLVHLYNKASSEWVLRIDPDEFFDPETIPKIKELIKNAPEDINSYTFQWEMWDGEKNVQSPAFIKKCLFRKRNLHFTGVMHADTVVDGKNERVNLKLRHQPLKNNVSWKNFLPKTNYQIGIHSKFFFSGMVEFDCFNYDKNLWFKHVENVKKNIWFYIIFEPMRQFLGQLRNGLWTSWTGFNMAMQQYYYFLKLYSHIWKMEQEKKN